MRLAYTVYHSDSDSPYSKIHYDHNGDKIVCFSLMEFFMEKKLINE